VLIVAARISHTPATESLRFVMAFSEHVAGRRWEFPLNKLLLRMR